MELALQILPSGLLSQYKQLVNEGQLECYENLADSDLSIDTFSFYTSVSAVFSSKIEGEQIELDSYIKHKRFGIEYLPDYTRKIDDLYNTYLFAQGKPLNRTNIEMAHAMLTENILPKRLRGNVRKSNMYVTTADGRIEYIAAQPFAVETELAKFYHDLELVLTAELSLQETFYFASLLHLVFAKIHPFDDGNGRTSRLIEKWFLGSKLGAKGWMIASERMYYEYHQVYYQNLRKLGLEYEQLDYAHSLPFLTMLPKALDSNN